MTTKRLLYSRMRTRSPGMNSGRVWVVTCCSDEQAVACLTLSWEERSVAGGKGHEEEAQEQVACPSS